jgi:hypothetical protein
MNARMTTISVVAQNMAAAVTIAVGRLILFVRPSLP